MTRVQNGQLVRAVELDVLDTDDADFIWDVGSSCYDVGVVLLFQALTEHVHVEQAEEAQPEPLTQGRTVKHGPLREP